MLYLKQSTASQSVLIGPFVDSTDGTTAETGLTIANTDIRLSKNGGNLAAKNSGGATHDEAGWYTITLDATDTDTVGRLQLHCKMTGALMVFAEFHVLEEAIYDALVGASATGLLPANVTQISGDSTAADNLEAMFDGTGYTDGSAPSTQAQVDAIGASSGGAFNYEMTGDNTGGAIKSVTFVGSQTGTFANVDAEDGSYHQITHATNAFDIVYSVNVGGGRTGVEVTWKGYIDGSNDSATIQVYDFAGTAWDTIATITGQAGTANVTITRALLSKHTGTGTDLGDVLVRIVTSGQSSPILYTDQLYVSAVNVGQTVGYSNGRIYIDTNASNTNTESYVDGTADNPVSTIAAANTINGNLSLNQFYVRAASSITFAASQTGETFHGEGWTLALGGQNVSNSHFYEAAVSGTGTTASGNPDWHVCDIGTVTLGPSDFHICEFEGTFTQNGAGNYFIHDCKSGVAGSGSPTFDFSGTGGATNVNVRNWFGGGTWTFDSNCTASIEVTKGGGHTITTGGGDVEFRGFCRAVSVVLTGGETVQIIAFTGPISISGVGTGSTVNIYGQHSGVTNTASGSPTVTDGSVDGSAVGTNVAAILEDTGTTIPATLSTIDTVVDGIKAVTDNLPDSGALSSLAQASALATVDTVVDNLNLGIIYGTAQTGTLSTTQASTDLTGYADDQLIGRVVIWTSGNCEGEATDITDYANTSGVLTFTALTTAPGNGDTFKIV